MQTTIEKETNKEKAIRLFQFLRDLSQMKAKPIKNMERGYQILWAENIPKSDLIFNVFDEPADNRGELWLEVTHPKIDNPPSLPDSLVPWIEDAQLWNLDAEAPEPKKVITRQKLADLPKSTDEHIEGTALNEPELHLANGEEIQVKISTSEDSSETTTKSDSIAKKKGRPGRRRIEIEKVKFEDQTDLIEEWSRYLEKWKPWAEKVRPFAPLLKLYYNLHEMYFRVQQLAEDYELLLGIGCLSWHTPLGNDVYRHLLVARADINFDAKRGTFTITPTSDCTGLSLEQDMLEMKERPQANSREEIVSLSKQIAEEFWNVERTEELLASYARVISNHGQYKDTLQAPDRSSSDAVIHYAPAIILRQRNEHAFVKLFDEIIEQVEESDELPTGIERLVEILDDELPESEKKNQDLEDDEVYFPLASNPDQREIAHRLKTRQGILVQGPPGTGKSHTIANLVCHLLAQGKRILVTSHTPRALTVLRDKFPAELQALCVASVGDDSALSRKLLEESVGGITAKQNSWSSTANKKNILDLQLKLSDRRAAEQWTLNSLREIKEKETYRHPSAFSTYSGTAQGIAQQLKKEAEIYSWFLDEIDIKSEPALSNADALKLVKLLKTFDKQRIQDALRASVDHDKLPSPEEIVDFNQKYKSAQKKLENLKLLKSHESFEAATKLTAQEREELVFALDELIALFFRIAKRREPYAASAAEEILGDHDRKWREILEITKSHLAKVPANYREIAERNLSGASNCDLYQLRADAEQLHEHLLRGGRIGFGPFKPKIVQRTEYLLSSVRLDGQLCDNSKTLAKLLELLELKILAEKLKSYWGSLISDIPENLVSAIASFRDYCEPLEDGLDLHQGMKSFQKHLTSYPALVAPDWNDVESIKVFKQVIESGAAKEEFNALDSRLKEIENLVRAAATNPNAHPLMLELADCISSLDDEKYHHCFEALVRISRDKREVQERETLLRQMKLGCPKLLSELLSNYADSHEKWKERFSQFEQAWNWKRANIWLINLSDPAYFQKLTKDLESIQTEIRQTVKDLAVEKAWKHTFDRLTEAQRQHLQAWSMAIRRIGKGKGKYAEKHRKEAKAHMEFCRQAIPAWIMPIHKVVESVRPGTDAFDVVIVDEASQSGPEAMFLMYIAKQLVVVGDDKQISPDFIGLDRSEVDELRKVYLKGIPNADAIGIDHSFFDQAKIRYKGKIRLKEHFRCMPEIIQFSNKLCYSTDPLIPLRQFGGGRLTPVVKTVYVKDGYHNEGAKVVNIPEAEAILEEVKRICSAPAYADKTIGIISLLNTSNQAAYIEEQLRNSERYISKKDLEERHVAVGDPYMFQGDERDIILLSMVSVPIENRRVHPLTSEKDERRFNVAVSRARDQLVLFHSVTQSDLSPSCIRHRLLTYCLNPSVEQTGDENFDSLKLQRALITGYELGTLPPKPFDSLFELDVFLRISSRGYRVIPQVEMNGYRIDLIVEGLRGRLAVECDGDAWHGPDRYDEDMARQRDLERCGMKFWRVRGSAFYLDPDKALADLWSTLEQAGIFPNLEKEEESIAALIDASDETPAL